MGRKRTAKFNRMTPAKLKEYAIAVSTSDSFKILPSVFGTKIDTLTDEILRVWNDDELVGEFKDWVYYVRCDKDDSVSKIIEAGNSLADELDKL